MKRENKVNTINGSKLTYIIGINNGVIVEVAKSLLNPNLVLAAFVYGKTGSAFLVGLLTSFQFLGAFLPQLYVSSLTEHRKRKKPFIVYPLMMRIMIMVLMIYLIWLSSRKDDMWIIYLFTISFFIYRLFRGSEFIVFWDFFGGAVPSARLGGFIAYRSLLSGIASMLSGILIVQPVLSSFSDDKSYLILSVITFFILSLDLIQLSMVKEIPNENPPERRNFIKTVSGSAGYLKESSNYRKLLVIRIFHRINMMTFAFLIPYAVERVGIIGMAGIFLSIIETSKFLSSILWGKISNAIGNRLVLIIGNIFFCLSAALVLSSSYLPEIFSFHVPGLPSNMDFPLLVFFLSLAAAGMAQTANTISFKAFVIESAPKNRRASSLAFINTVTVPMALIAPVIGAAVETDSGRYSWFYLILAFSGFITSYLAYRLKEVRTYETGAEV